MCYIVIAWYIVSKSAINISIFQLESYICGARALPNSHNAHCASRPHQLAGQQYYGRRRESRRQQMCATSHDRLACKTLEEREARLQQVHDRLASKTAEERQACVATADVLDWQSINWHPRLPRLHPSLTLAPQCCAFT